MLNVSWKEQDSHNSIILLYTGIVVFGLVWEKTAFFKNRVFATNSNFLIPKSLVVNLRFYKRWILIRSNNLSLKHQRFKGCKEKGIK